MLRVLPPLTEISEADAEALFREAKQRARGRRLVVGGTAVVLIGTLAFGIAIASRGNVGSASPPPPPPGFASGHLDEIVHAASSAAKSGSVTSALIYSTTRKRAYDAGTGMDPVPGGERVYVVVLEGHFICNFCSYPPGASAPRGTVITMTFNQPGMGDGGTALGVGNSPPGPGMGKPYTLVLR